MTDIFDTFKAYPDDPAAVMSKRVVAEAIAEIERLRADLAYSDKRFSDFVERTSKRTEKADVELAQAHADLAAAREALKPFAKAADNFDSLPIKDPEGWFAYSGQSSFNKVSGAITVGNLRRARAALKGDGDE